MNMMLTLFLIWFYIMFISYDVDVDEYDDDDLGQRQKCFPVNLLFPKPVGNHPEKYFFLNSIAQNWSTGFEKKKYW